jgi:hypothetical protein
MEELVDGLEVSNLGRELQSLVSLISDVTQQMDVLLTDVLHKHKTVQQMVVHHQQTDVDLQI